MSNTGKIRNEISIKIFFSSDTKMKQYSILLIFAVTLLFGCRAGEEASLRGRILLWHDWREEDAAVLNDLITGFNALNPDIRVVSVAVPPGTLRQRYEETAGLGLGPDLLILSDADLRPLADANLIQPVQNEAVNTEKFLSTAVDSLRYEDSLYGLPVSLQPVALFYNVEEVDAPARTLEQLRQQAEAGQSVALNSQFLPSLWGLPAFGGSLFDEEGRVALNQGGYTNWLNWLKTAQDTPGMILDRNDEVLRDLFVTGKVSYYVGSPQALPDLRAQMGDAQINVAPLPAGPSGPSGPLLHVEAIFFNQASSPHQAELALVLADYLTNAEQSAQLMRQTDRVPANRRVRVDQQAFPIIAGFAAQARTAVATPQLSQMDILVDTGEDMLRSVLAGLIDVNEAAFQLAQMVNNQIGFETPPVVQMPADCNSTGELLVWHTWQGTAAAVLNQIAADFMMQCDDSAIQLRQFDPETLLEQLVEGNANEARPDLILGSSEWTRDLISAASIAPVSGFVEDDILQRYVAMALNTLRTDGQLYGLPINLNLAGLYYNAEIVTDPASTMDELLNEAALGNEIALPVLFEQAFWGVASFGEGSLFDESFRLTLIDSGFVAWLTWLQEAQEMPGFVLSGDDAVLQALFSSSTVAYYAGSSQRLDTLQAALGSESVRVTNLPAGPGGVAAPRLTTDAIFFDRTAIQTNGDLALDFALFLTAIDAQTMLMSQAQLIPANVNVDTTGYPAVEGFLAQAQTAVVWPQVPQITTVQEQGDRLYESVVLRQLPAAQAACEFEISINQEYGFVIDQAELPAICLDNDPLTDE